MLPGILVMGGSEPVPMRRNPYLWRNYCTAFVMYSGEKYSPDQWSGWMRIYRISTQFIGLF